VALVGPEQTYRDRDGGGVGRNRAGVGPKAGNGNTEVCFEAREASPGGWAQVRLGRIVDVFGDRVPSRLFGVRCFSGFGRAVWDASRVEHQEVVPVNTQDRRSVRERGEDLPRSISRRAVPTFTVSVRTHCRIQWSRWAGVRVLGGLAIYEPAYRYVSGLAIDRVIPILNPTGHK